MAKTVADMTTGELRDMMEDLIEEKLVQPLGDPDEGLEIRESLRDRLQAQQQAVAAGTRGENLSEGILVPPDTSPKVIEHLQEKFFALTLLTVGAGKSSAALDSFAGWLLAGFAAVLTFLLGHLDSLGKYLSVESIRHAAYIFIGAMAAVVVEKAISVIVVGSAEASAIGREIGKATADHRIELDLPVALRECEKAFFPPMNKLLGRSLAKMEAGDLAASARGLTKGAQVQSGFVLIEVCFIIWAAIVLIQGVAV